MGRPRKYADQAARAKAYRDRQATADIERRESDQLLKQIVQAATRAQAAGVPFGINMNHSATTLQNARNLETGILLLPARWHYRRMRSSAPAAQRSPSPYEVLAVATTATAEEIKAAWRELSRALHPDQAQRVYRLDAAWLGWNGTVRTDWTNWYLWRDVP